MENGASLEMFKIGTQVEVVSCKMGYSRVWYEANIIAPPSSSSSGNSKGPKFKWGFWVKHKYLLGNDEVEPLCEYIKKRTFLRPKPPRTAEDQCRFFQVNDVVDAFHLGGWWTGVVIGHEGIRIRVGFKDPDEELEFSRQELRTHLDWVDGNWVHRSVPLREKKKRPRIVGSVDNQSIHAVEERIYCSPARGAKSTDGNCDNLGDTVEKIVDRGLNELNEEDTAGVVDVRSLVAEKSNVHSLRHTREKDGNPCDSKFQIVKDSSKTSTNERPDQVSHAVPEGVVEKQVFKNTSHIKVNEQNPTNQTELTSTNGKNISAGVSATTAQSCLETSPCQPNGMLSASNSSMSTPVPSLPIRKYSKVWRAIESLDIFAKTPQDPHFSPLAEYEEDEREELALQKMIKYAVVAEKITNLTIADLKTSTVINDILASVKDLEVCGFDVMSIQHCFDNLRLKERQTNLQNKLEELRGRIRYCSLEKEKAEEEFNKIMMKMKGLENRRETMNQEIVALISEKGIICDEIGTVQHNFDGIAASVRQIFC